MLAQLEFLSAQLRCLNEFNTMFQSSEPMLHHLRGEVTKLLRDIISNFISIDVRNEDPFTIDVDCMYIQLPLDKVYMGILATNTLFELRDDMNSVLKVKRAYVEFLFESVIRQTRLRFDMKDPIFKLLEFLTPSNAVKCVPSSLNELFMHLAYLADIADMTSADLEWRKQALEEPEEMADTSATQFWQKRLNVKTINGTLKYPNLRKVVACVMSLPSSNASVERVFSLLKLIKTNSRNALKRDRNTRWSYHMHANTSMKANDVQAHQLQLSAEFIREIKSVKSNATDTELSELVCESFKFDFTRYM